jgi:hypothetical protein
MEEDRTTKLTAKLPGGLKPADARAIRTERKPRTSPLDTPGDSLTRFDACLEARAEIRQIPKRDSLSNLAHNVKKKRNVMMGVQDGG